MASTSGATHPPQYTSYQEKYLDASTDVFAGRYQDVLSIFKMKASESTRATKIIQDQVLSTLEVQPHNYLQLTHSNEKYHVTVIHRPTVYSVPMGVQSEHDGTVTAFVGDVRSGMAPNVVFWPEEPFTPSTLVNVPTPEVIDAAYAGDAEIQLVGPYQDGEAAVDPITVRPLMYLPPKFVPLVMSAPYLTPRECWNRLAAQLRLTQESADAHKPLLQWLRAACTFENSLGITICPFRNQPNPNRDQPLKIPCNCRRFTTQSSIQVAQIFLPPKVRLHVRREK